MTTEISVMYGSEKVKGEPNCYRLMRIMFYQLYCYILLYNNCSIWRCYGFLKELVTICFL